jgi:hypothetical protein
MKIHLPGLGNHLKERIEPLTISSGVAYEDAGAVGSSTLDFQVPP